MIQLLVAHLGLQPLFLRPELTDGALVLLQLTAQHWHAPLSDQPLLILREKSSYDRRSDHTHVKHVSLSLTVHLPNPGNDFSKRGATLKVKHARSHKRRHPYARLRLNYQSIMF